MLRFTCECGKRYATRDVPAPDRIYRLRCKACGHLIVVKGSAAAAEASRTPTPAPAAAPSRGARPPASSGDEPLQLEAGLPDPAGSLDEPLAPGAPAPRLPAEPPPPEIGPDEFQAVGAPGPAQPEDDPFAALRRELEAVATSLPPAPEDAAAAPAEQPTAAPQAVGMAAVPEESESLRLAAPAPEPPPAPAAAPAFRPAPLRPAGSPGQRGDRRGLLALAVVSAAVVVIGGGVALSRFLSAPGRQPPPTEAVPPPPAPAPAEARPDPSPGPAAPAPEARPPSDAPATPPPAAAEAAPAAAPAAPAPPPKASPPPPAHAAPARAPERAAIRAPARPADRKPKGPQRPDREEPELEPAVAAAAASPPPAPAPEPAAPPPAPEPAAEPPQARELTQADIQKVLGSHRKAFDACLKDPWRGTDQPAAARQITVRFTIDPGGTVGYPTIDDVAVSGAPVGQCLKAAAKAMTFSAFPGEPVKVDTPITIPAR